MKKTILLGATLFATAALFSAVASAQESRQDISISGTGIIGPTVHGNGVNNVSSRSGGVLLSYRYLVTPHSGLELNYSFGQYTQYYNISGQTVNGQSLYNPIHTRQQELTGAYVFGLTFKNYNPFVEAGVGGILFTPIQEGSGTLDARQSGQIGGLFGGGVAYELTPSFDVRVQYRGLILKNPSFGIDKFRTNRYEVESMPAIGIAYHF